MSGLRPSVLVGVERVPQVAERHVDWAGVPEERKRLLAFVEGQKLLASAFGPLRTLALSAKHLLMRLLVLPSILIMLSACGATGPMPRTPDAHLANQIEEKLRTVSCVGSIDHWERHYEYRSKPSLLALLATLGTSNRWFDYRTVEVRYYQAGFEEFRARRVRHNGVKGMQFDADDRNYKLVFGHYDIPTHTASIWACGPNAGTSPDVKIVVR